MAEREKRARGQVKSPRAPRFIDAPLFLYTSNTFLRSRVPGEGEVLLVLVFARNACVFHRDRIRGGGERPADEGETGRLRSSVFSSRTVARMYHRDRAYL